MSEWISVQSRMPPPGIAVRVKANDIVNEFEEIAVRYECPEYGTTEWETIEGANFPCIVTHWMPLPEPPNDTE